MAKDQARELTLHENPSSWRDVCMCVTHPLRQLSDIPLHFSRFASDLLLVVYLRCVSPYSRSDPFRPLHRSPPFLLPCPRFLSLTARGRTDVHACVALLFSCEKQTHLSKPFEKGVLPAGLPADGRALAHKAIEYCRCAPVAPFWWCWCWYGVVTGGVDVGLM